MHPRDRAPSAPGGLREVLAGCTGALAVLPVLLTLGLLAYSALPGFPPQAALLAAFVSAGLGGLVHAALSRTTLPAAGLSSATALTLAALVAQLIADPRLVPGTPAGIPGILALCGFAVLLSGALQVGFALLGLARLARVVPQPVLAGFMNSAALLVALAQLPLLLDLPQGSTLSFASLEATNPVALLLGLGTAAVIWLLDARWPRLPAAFLGLLLGTAAHALWSAVGTGAAAGARIGPLPIAWPWPPALLALPASASLELLQAHAGPVALTALALAAIGTLESLLNVRAVDQLLSARHAPGRELLVLGGCNMLCGLLGGMPLVAMRIRALATLRAGGRGRVAALAGPAALCLLYVLGAPLLAMLPLPVLAGVMLTVALGLADRWTGRMLRRWWAGEHSRELVQGLGVVALVVGTTLWRGMVAGVGLGVLLSLVLFAVRMNRSLVRERYLASARPSRRIYPAAVEARLKPLRERIVVFELDGALFFGSAERLLEEADTLPADCRCLVLDLRRVSAIDESGEMALQQLLNGLEARGIQVELAGIVEASVVAEALRGFGAALPRWPDTDRAVEAVERRLLDEGQAASDVRAMAEVPLTESSLLAGLDTAQAAVVAAHLRAQHLATGEVLFAEGDAGDRLYVMGSGSVSALSRPDKRGRTQRYLSVSPGMMIGETAMLDGGGRTATAVADAPAVVYALSAEALDEISRTHPAVAVCLHRNVALHLSQRLRGAAGAWNANAQ